MADFYWINNAGDWYDTTHWSTSSGGAGGSGPPTSSDNVFFDGSSFTLDNQDVTISEAFADFNSMDWTGVTHTPRWVFHSDTGGAGFNCYGSMTLSTGMSSVVTGTAPLRYFNSIFKSSTGTPTINAKGVTLPIETDFQNSVEITLSSAFRSEGIRLQSQFNQAVTLTTNNYGIICGFVGISTNNSDYPSTLNAGTSTINVNYSVVDTGFRYTDDSSIFVGPSSLININYDAVSGNTDIGLRTQTLGEVRFLGVSDSVNPYYFDTSDGTAGTTTLTLSPGNTIHIGAGLTTQTFTANGTSGNNIFLRKDGGINYTITATIVSVSYIDVMDCIAAGSIPFVDTGGTDSGNNINWLFPSASGSHRGGILLMADT